MKVKAKVTFEYNITAKEIKGFRQHVFEYIEGEGYDLTIDNIPIDMVQRFLATELPNEITEMYNGYYNGGVEIDDYFKTITFDYCGETVCNWVKEVAERIIADKED